MYCTPEATEPLPLTVAYIFLAPISRSSAIKRFSALSAMIVSFITPISI